MEGWATLMMWLAILGIVCKALLLGLGQPLPAPSRMAYALDVLFGGGIVIWGFIVGVRLW